MCLGMQHEQKRYSLSFASFIKHILQGDKLQKVIQRNILTDNLVRAMKEKGTGTLTDSL